MNPPQWQSAFLARHRLPDSYLAYAQQWFAPLAGVLAAHQENAKRPVLVAMNGSQGSGKTTVCDYLRETLETDHDLRVASLSLDDFYLTREQRQDISTSIHSLLVTRGVPGTHDMALLQATINDLTASTGKTIAIPRFDKSIDDRLGSQDWDNIAGPVDLVLLEGWCLGVKHQDEAALELPINRLESDEDSQGEWRRYVNATVKRDFEPLYELVDQWVMLCAPSFDCVYRWRLQQEHRLAQATATGAANQIMTDAQVARFIQYYERLTRQCLDQLPDCVNHLYRLDEQRQVICEFHQESAAQ